MLKPTSDRLDYGELLAPPSGFEVVAAIGTTYSLDFDALVGVCIALGLSETTNSTILNNPVYLLETLRKTGDKVALFCEAGQIHAPANNSSLYILLEKMIYEVKVKKHSKKANYPSFHPKFWLIKYSNKQRDLVYRIIVMSRNLTFDHSWDVAFSIDGSRMKQKSKQSKPLIDFIDYLMPFIIGSDDNIKAKRKLLRDMTYDLEYVRFTSDLQEFTETDFIPVGVTSGDNNKYRMENYPLFSDTFHEILIVSPFLTDSVINDFNNRNKNIEDPICTLITRRVALENLKPDHCNKFQIYTMKDAIVEGESTLSEDEILARRQDIHAKIYLWRKYSDAELYLGSLNASHSALNGNIEFMVRLKSKNRYLNTKILTKSLFGGEPCNPNNPFELTMLPPNVVENINQNDALDKMIKTLCRGDNSANISVSGDKYAITITFDNLINAEYLTISPLLSKKSEPLAPIVTINDLSLLQISEFYRITSEKDNCKVQRIIKIKTANLPQNRESAVVNDVINNSQSFYQYIAFLLSDDYLLTALEATSLRTSGFIKNRPPAQMPALYERLLSNASTHPERFEEIDYLIKMITAENVVPKGFTEVYNTIRKVVGLHG